MKISSLKFLSKILVIFFSLILASCALQKNKEPQIRIVDLDGKSHGVITRTPPLNMQALENQGIKRENNLGLQSQDLQQISQMQKNEAPNSSDYGATSSEIIQKTLQNNSNQTRQVESWPNAQKQNPIVSTREMQNQQAAAVEPAVEYDLATVEEDKKPEKKSAKTISPQTNVKGLFVQVGSFSSLASAKEKLQEMEKFHRGKIETVNGEKTFYRALLGPFASKVKATQLMKKIKASGYEAVLLRNK